MGSILKALEPILSPDGIVAIQFTPVGATLDGLNTVLPGIAAKRLRVLGYVLVVTSVGVISVEDTAGRTLATFPCATNGGASYAGGLEAPAFETAIGAGLAIRNPAGVDTYGHIAYVTI